MFIQYIGELAGIGTSIAYAFGSTLFTISGRSLGASLINRTRLVFALLGVMLVHLVWFGSVIPDSAGFQPWFWLGISGLIGFAIGDGLLFQAFLLIGPRISMLIFALSPVLGAIIAWIFLGETLVAYDIIGIVITIAGIALVVTEKSNKVENEDTLGNPRAYHYGLLFAFGGAFCQALGNVFSKVGLANDFPPLSALVIRLMIATIIIWIFAVAQKQMRTSYSKLKTNPRAFVVLMGATLMGPIIGVWLSLISVQNTSVGVSSTLSSLTPVILIPIAYFVFGDKITKQAIIGTLLAVGGSTLLFF